MVKTSRTILSIALAAATLGSLNTISFADNYVGNVNEFDTLDEYIEYCVPRHIYAQNLDVGDSIEYSNPVAIYDFEQNTIIGSEIFLIDDGKIIGKMEIYGENGDYTSYFDTTITDEIIDAFNEGDHVAIGSYEHSLLLYSDSDGFSFVDGVESNTVPDYIPAELYSISAQDSVLVEYESLLNAQIGIPSENMYSVNSIASPSVPVTHVHNSTTYDSNGQCWASCVAMKVNYHNGYSITSNKVYEDLTSAGIDFSTNGTQKALTYYNYPNYVRTGTAMTPANVATQIVNGKPIIMHISNGTYQHAVIIYGIVLDYSSSTYNIDDPNYTTVRSIVHSTTLNTLSTSINSYYSLGYYYSQWYNSFY